MTYLYTRFRSNNALYRQNEKKILHYEVSFFFIVALWFTNLLCERQE